jgi:site-specific DNA-methyltransferase (adenine-specific)
MWIYGSGFPKSHQLGEGWGTALKPAHEPIVMARKPIEGTVAENTLQYGVGGLNIDATRIQMQDGDKMDIRRYNAYHDTFNSYEDGESAKGKEYVVAEPHEGGRWPANVILDEEAGQILDKQSGNKKSAKRGSKYNKPTEHTNTYTPVASDYRDDNTYGDEGGASRFFYCPKASKKDRDHGLDKFEKKFAPTMQDGIGAKEHNPQTATLKSNIHPTVKPTDLMKYLIRLVTPKDGIVLDPFMGSGSTGKAAMQEGMWFVGIEREREYFEIAKQRIEYEADKRKFW